MNYSLDNFTLNGIGNSSCYNVSAINGTAIGGDNVTVNNCLGNSTLNGTGDSITFTIDILSDMICEYDEETFSLVILNERGSIVTHDGNYTIVFKISADDQCREYHLETKMSGVSHSDVPSTNSKIKFPYCIYWSDRTHQYEESWFLN